MLYVVNTLNFLSLIRSQVFRASLPSTAYKSLMDDNVDNVCRIQKGLRHFQYCCGSDFR